MTPTDACCLTPRGSGAIAVIRISGPEAIFIVDSLLKAASGRNLADISENDLLYGRLFDVDESLDDVLVVRHDGTTVDVCTHGGRRIIERVLGALNDRGAIVNDEPNVSCAFLGKSAIDREALDALVHAQTERAVLWLIAQRRLLTNTLQAIMKNQFQGNLINTLRSMAVSFDRARLLLTGAQVVLAGPPNAGKSTLFNALVGRQASVVSPIAGTTRDWVRSAIDIDGVPVTIVDTAGDRALAEPLETVAISRGREQASAADLILHVDEWNDDHLASLEQRPTAPWPLPEWLQVQGKQIVRIINKIDLADLAVLESAKHESAGELGGPVYVSGQSGQGLDQLVIAIRSALRIDGIPVDVPCAFSQNQVDALNRAAKTMESGRMFEAQQIIESELLGQFPA